MVLHAEKLPSTVGDQMGQKGELWGWSERLQQLVCGKQEDRVRHTQMVHATDLCD